MVDIDKVLKNTVKKGKVKLGVKETKTAITNGTARLVVMAKNCPSFSEISTLTTKKNIPVYEYEMKAIDLGYACGKPFSVSVFAVLEDGGSNIMQIVKQRK